MIAYRTARILASVRPMTFRAPLQRRGYAEAVPDKIKLSLALPHQVRNDKSQDFQKDGTWSY